ncbi:hypothetical protein ATE84_1108 [Aquimarina sp. MAR_2010_214]|uniref:hypothetical protein n=1 Tax=Aquimarina sp. MAR_2010_214 TaxID=1250026 RepID=UPI000CACB6A6|nr:hypothetical protein [Aquimarina sp. MAR_2010_214]PKV49092.1 hypothetical protein ATE84_1108 [Aquimarina sp. MAR_2010_214]
MGNPLNTEFIGKHISEIPNVKLSVKETNYNPVSENFRYRVVVRKTLSILHYYNR